jgi:transcriptional regulator with XRE-family HTH domain
MDEEPNDQFADRDYRHDYTESFFDTLISAQIRALRKRFGWTQEQLGKETGTTQSGISAFESSDYSRWSVNTLRNFARVFDVALVIKFASFSEALKNIEEFDDSYLLLPSFDEDAELRQIGGETSDSVIFGAGEGKRLDNLSMKTGALEHHPE